MIGPENIGGSIDEIEMLLFGHDEQLAAHCAKVSRFRNRGGGHIAAIALLRHKFAIISPGRVRSNADFALAVQPAGATVSQFKGYQPMRKIVLAAAIAGAALSLAACSNKTEEATGEAMDSAMADASTNADAAGEAVSTAAADATEAAGNAVDAAEATAEDAADKAEAATDEAAAN